MKSIKNKSIVYFILIILLFKPLWLFDYSSIEWRPLNYINLSEDQSSQIFEILSSLEELDDVQNIFTNANLKNL